MNTIEQKWMDASLSPEEKKSLLDMAKVLTEYDLWSWMTSYTPEEGKGFLWSSHPNIDRIMSHPALDYHSGATAASCLRSMEKVAKDNPTLVCNLQPSCDANPHSSIR